MKIIFMGTPDFACPALEALLAQKDFEIIAVYTREPQIAGRGHKLTNSAIHNLALQHNLEVIIPKTLKDESVQNQFRNFNADLAVVVAYGLLLPQAILDGTKFGCINIHPSALPKWRGAAPIQRTIMAGDKTTAVDIIKMDKGLDSGDIISSQEIILKGDETYATLAPQLSQIGAELLVQTIKNIHDKNFTLTKQDSVNSTYAKKIEKEECEINWKEDAKTIEAKIRALNGCLGAYFLYKGEKIKVFSAKIIDETSQEKNPGEILNEKFFIQCSKGIIQPSELQKPGKRIMKIEEFLLGFRI